MIICDHVSINYGKEIIIDDFNMHIKKGEKIVLSGSSGSGKSTLLHAVMGFIKPSSGTITVKKQIVNPKNIRDIRKNISWLPQELAFNVKDSSELAFMPFQFSVNRGIRPTDNEMNKMLEILLLSPSILKKQTDEISGGQKQRILIASVLLLQRPVLLLDEPTSALDAEAVSALLTYIHQQKDLTVLSASHDSLWINSMSRIINLKNTKV